MHKALVDGTPYETTTHLVSHLLREIESALRQALKPLIEDEQTKKKKGGEVHLGEISAVSATLGANEDLQDAWMALTGVGPFKDTERGLSGHAHRDDMKGPRPIDENFRDNWDRAEYLIEHASDLIERRYELVLNKIENLLRTEHPTDNDAKALVRSILRSPAALEVFLRRVSNPGWIPLLIEVGLFSNPPGKEYDPKRKAHSFPYWEPSRALRNAAEEGRWPPELIVAALEAVPLNDNESVIGDLVKTAQYLPPKLASIWVEGKLIEHISSLSGGELSFFVFNELGRLVANLADSGEALASLHLARVHFALRENERAPLGYRHEPQTLSGDTGMYGRSLERDLPALAEAAPKACVSLLIDILEEYIGFSTDRPPPLDGSKHWINEVGSAKGFSDTYYEIGGALAQALFNTVETGIDSGACSIDEALACLLSHDWSVFRRCALALIRSKGNAEHVASLLSNRATLFDPELHSETIHLIKARLDELDPNARAYLLTDLAMGPPPEFWVERASLWNQDLSPAEAEDWSAMERTRLLTALEMALPTEWVEEHEALFPAKPTQTLQLPDAAQEKLAEVREQLVQDPARALSTLTKWTDIEEWPNVGVLALELERAVSHRSGPYAAVAEQLVQADATLIKAFSEGLNVAEVDEWGSLLQLFAWATRQHREIEGRSWDRWLDERNGDPHWGWAWKQIASKLGKAMVEGSIPWDYHEHVWSVIEPISFDPDTGVDDTQGRGSWNRAINSTRGEALSAAISFVAWARRETDEALVAVPYAFKVLSEHLSPEADRSPAMRAVYGRHLPTLVYASRPWVVEHLPVLFPKDDVLRTGTWDGYSYARHDYSGIYDLLRPLYLAELDCYSDGNVTEVAHPDVLTFRDERTRHEVVRLIKQVVLACLLGMDKVEEGSPVGSLVTHPSVLVRSHAIAQFAYSLREGWAERAPQVVTQRAVAFWDQRIATGRLSEEEGKAFTLWPPAMRLDPRWALKNLVVALRTSGGTAERVYRLIEWLPDVATANPLQAVEALNLLTQADAVGYYTHEQPANVTTVISTAAKAGGEALQAAREVVNRIAARGGGDFRDALNPTDE
ncbi:MAG: hypothetical protein AAFP15_16020 [Bacteroidota bacterium]